MSKPLSTDDGENEATFDSLEERIVYTERDKDQETITSVRLPNSHYRQMDMIQRELGTNKIEILARAYNAGLSELRDIDFVERSDEILDMTNTIAQVTTTKKKYWEKSGSDMQRYQSYEIDIKENYTSQLNDPEHLPIKDSVLSEVKNRLMDVVMIKPGVHRPIITVGLSTSENSIGIIEKDAKQIISSFDDALEESRAMCENNMASCLPTLYPVFKSEGIDEKHLELIKESAEFMKTENKSPFELYIRQIEENCDVL